MVMIYDDEKIHDKERFEKYENKFCSKCDFIEHQDCYYRRTINEKKWCLFDKYHSL